MKQSMIYIFLKWFIYILSSIPILLLTYIFAPILSTLCDSEGNLPKLLRLFQTYNATCFGDAGWKLMYPTDYKTWWRRTQWLWRNPAGTYMYWLGVIPQKPYSIIGDPKTSNIPGHSGWVYVRCSNCFMFYYIRQWSNTNKCIRLVVGWKLFSICENPEQEFTDKKPITFQPSVTMNFEK